MRSSDHSSALSRRAFLRRAGTVTAGGVAYLAAPGVVRAVAAPKRNALKTEVAVLGGGVGGLTAAHELAERGFRVTVFEPKALGGKARSIPVPDSGTAGRSDLPGEHGFRFFPGFYKNIPDTMRRIPFVGNANGVFDNLVDASQELITFSGNRQLYAFPSFDATNGPLEGAESLMTVIGIAA